MVCPVRQRGFTLVELIMVIVIMGVIGGMVSVFMRAPIDAYLDSGRRAALTDVADTTVRRMARDIRVSLPNSVRLAGTTCVDFIPAKTGGRYRTEDVTPGDGTALDFSVVDTSFQMLGVNPAPLDQRIEVNDVVVVYNLGIAGADAYANAVDGNNVAVVNGVADVAATPPNAAATLITLDARATPFPLASGGNRFHVIDRRQQVVSYVCSGAAVVNGNGTGTLFRVVRALPQATAVCPATSGPGVVAAVLMRNLSACNFSYNPNNQADAVLQVNLGVTQANETVNLYHEIHVHNTP